MELTIPGWVSATVIVACLGLGFVLIVGTLAVATWKAIDVMLRARGDLYAAVWFITHRRRITIMIDEIMKHERMRRGDFLHESSQWSHYRKLVSMFADKKGDDQ